ncbi:MAG: MOSC domain-containing protein [Chloroflexota bacterium]|nr:MOSC domain-containing protein [Chloroflexota bacterium]
MPEIGPIIVLQVQVSSLKVGEAPRKRYDPRPILPVPALELDPDGAIGLPADGSRVVDVHHLRHAATKQRRGLNGLSIGFTSHYAEMRDRFDNALPDGMAGENILVATDRHWTEEELAPGLAIVTKAGRRLAIERVMVAAPCVEFTRWAMRFPDDGRPDRTVTEGVRFLDHGMRGYYAAYDGEPVTIAVGDRVFVRDQGGQ